MKYFILLNVFFLATIAFAESTYHEQLLSDFKSGVIKIFTAEKQSLPDFERAEKKAKQDLFNLIIGLDEMNIRAFGTASQTIVDWLKKTESLLSELLDAKKSEITAQKKCPSCLPALQKKYDDLSSTMAAKSFVTADRRKVRDKLKDIVNLGRVIILNINKDCKTPCSR